MNFMGIGLPEVGVILLVAFLVLGPSRSISMARAAGKVIGEVRRSFTDVAAAVSQEHGEESTGSGWKAPKPQARDEPPDDAGNG